MLVLSRKPGERILVGPNIRITVTQVDRNKVRIGIEAPPDVHICREEIAMVCEHEHLGKPKQEPPCVTST